MFTNGHIVMLPFMAHGHLIPFLSLARTLRWRHPNLTISIATTPLNVRYLRSTMASGESQEILLKELYFCSSDHGLPPDTDNTENLPLNLVGVLFESSVSLAGPLERLLSEISAAEGHKPVCIISDVFFGWSVEVARRFGIKCFSFSTGGAYGTLAYVSIWLNLPHRSTDSDEFAVPGFPEQCRFHRSQLHRFIRAANGTDPWSRFFQVQIALSLTSDGWICNSVEEIEPLGLDLLRNYLKLPVWPTGPLLPSSMLGNKFQSSSISRVISTERAGKKPGVPLEKCTEWLNSHRLDSVLYISFGSQNTISASQMRALAVGLEASGKPFIWVIRPPLGFDMKGEFRSEWLPEGFERKVTDSNQGLLVRTWAPQLGILSHKSTRAFLSHCGWNSVMESLSQRVPIIGWPMAAEQAYNSKMMVEEMGVCMELARGVENEIDSGHVKRVVELVMENVGKGQDMKKKAIEIGEKIGAAMRIDGGIKGSSLKALDDFVTTILSS
ncbi:hypothetical protein CRG98_030605 [Punica granatum]|uniref:Glycosyltransferase n=1 Tax=Punica granatum TaxID=22663 RepID=A0A2I0IYE3_PUNGR|nr:hypothetical protein CRG98_030605 [Punica granatum]